MDADELIALFRSREKDTREGNSLVISDAVGKPSMVGKHEARNRVHLESVLAEADKECPRAADTIRWLLWHEILDAQWYMHMAEMLKNDDTIEEAD